MRYTNLGNTGLIVSRLGFGAMTFTQGNRDIPSVFKLGEEGANRLVGQALDAGVNFFDTADAYAKGESETLLGRALGGRRQDVVIATKVGFRSGEPLNQTGLSRRHILWSVEQSLRRLGTDWIDLLVVHKEDHFTPIEETLEALDTVVKHGKVRYLGFSNWSAWKAAAAMEIQKARGLAPFTHGQMYYSLLGRDIELDVIPMMQRYGLGLTVWSPLAAGFLGGRFTRETIDEPGNRFTGFNFLGLSKEQGFRATDELARLAGKRGISLAQMAIGWLLAKPAVTSVLLGASKAEQLADNLKAIDVGLDPEEMAALDAMTPLPRLYPNWMIDSVQDAAVSEATK